MAVGHRVRPRPPSPRSANTAGLEYLHSASCPSRCCMRCRTEQDQDFAQLPEQSVELGLGGSGLGEPCPYRLIGIGGKDRECLRCAGHGDVSNPFGFTFREGVGAPSVLLHSPDGCLVSVTDRLCGLLVKDVDSSGLRIDDVGSGEANAVAVKIESRALVVRRAWSRYRAYRNGTRCDPESRSLHRLRRAMSSRLSG